MAFTELGAARCRRIAAKYIDGRRPPPHIRAELDLGFRVTGQSVELFEVRPVWRGAPGEKMESPYAKATYVRRKGTWRVYWRRADLEWHSYEPNAEVDTLEEFLAVVERDEYHCFHG